MRYVNFTFYLHRRIITCRKV